MALEDQVDPMPQEPADLIQRDDTGTELVLDPEAPTLARESWTTSDSGTVGSSPRMRTVWSILRSGRTERDRHRQSARDGFSSSTPCGDAAG